MRTMDDIYSEMCGEYKKYTGLELSDSGDMALRMRALAYELFTLESQNQWLKRQCFPQTASQKQLDYHGEIRGLKRVSPQNATGSIRFFLKNSLPNNLVIPAGITCMSAANTEFITTAQATIIRGFLYCDVPAKARYPGLAGNTAANSIIFMANPPTGVSQCSNPNAFSGGIEPESDSCFRERILQSYKKLPNGANAEFYHGLAMSIPGVGGAAVIPRARGRGTIDVVVSSPSGQPSSALISEISALLQSMREICVDINVKAPEPVGVSLQIAVEPQDGYSFKDASDDASNAIYELFDGSLLGKDLLRIHISKVLIDLDSIKNFLILTPSDDISVSGSQLPTLYNLNISPLGE